MGEIVLRSMSILMSGSIALLVFMVCGSDGYTSGSSSASGSASSYASAAPSPTPTPTPTPTPATSASAATKVIHTIRSTMSLAGVPASAFNPNTPAGQKVRLAFRKTIAKGMKVCGLNGNSQCGSDDVVIVSVTRRRRTGAKVDFYVKTSSAANAQAGATSLNTMLTANGGGDFITSLKSTAKAEGAAELEQATGLKVEVAPVAGTSTVPTPAPTVVAGVGRAEDIPWAGAILSVAVAGATLW